MLDMRRAGVGQSFQKSLASNEAKLPTTKKVGRWLRRFKRRLCPWAQPHFEKIEAAKAFGRMVEGKTNIALGQN